MIKKEKRTIFLALLIMLLWGSLFPCVKLAYKNFSIDYSKPANLLLFAGVRFLICGAVILLFCFTRKKNLKLQGVRDWSTVCLIGLISVVLHYSCSYIGLAKTESSATALLKQLGTLVFIAFSFLFFKEDKFSLGKLLGAFLGFAGIVVLNFDSFSIKIGVGQVLIIIASFCTVAASLVTKKRAANIDSVVVTGYTQLIGGLVLCVVGLCAGGNLGEFSWTGMATFSYICVASIISYCLWYGILKNSHLSILFIIKFTEPLFACVFGAILLSENIFRWQYLFASVFVFLGVLLGAMQINPKEKKEVLKSNREEQGLDLVNDLSK